MPKRPCGQVGCSELVDKGYCSLHARSVAMQKEKWRGSAASRGYDKAWAKVRAQALKRDNYCCKRCERRGIVRLAVEVHHIYKVATHPQFRLVLRLVVSVCRECHEVLEASQAESMTYIQGDGGRQSLAGRMAGDRSQG